MVDVAGMAKGAIGVLIVSVVITATNTTAFASAYPDASSLVVLIPLAAAAGVLLLGFR